MNELLGAVSLPSAAVRGATAPTVSIRRSFNGPRGSANGGFAAGTFASLLAGDATVVLRHRIPLGRKMSVAEDGAGGLLVVRGRRTLAEVHPRRSAIAPPPVLPTLRQAERASTRDLLTHERNPFSWCYVCSAHRRDGLGVVPNPLDGQPDMLAALFRAPRSHALLPPELVWAALDCPSYPAEAFAARRIALLGTIAVEQYRSIRGGERLAIVGWTISRGTRSTVTGSGMVDASGQLVAAAQATWVDLVRRR